MAAGTTVLGFTSLVRLGLIAAALVLAAAAPPSGNVRQRPARPAATRAAKPIPIPLQPQPGTELDRAARQLVAQEMADPTRVAETLVLVGSAVLGGARAQPALFVQVQSPRECGSSGCSTSVYLGGLKVLDSVSGVIAMDTRRHRGMRDLIVGSGERYVWNGAIYKSTRAAPPVDLRPRKPRRRRPR